MRVFLLTIVLAAGAIAPAWGQYGVFEVGLGSNEGRPGRYHDRFGSLGLQGYVEGRYCFNDSWAGSFQLMGGEAKNRNDGYETKQLLATIYCDYSYRTENIKFFAGFGLGSGYVDDETLPIYNDNTHYIDGEDAYDNFILVNQFIFGPRVGMELWDIARFTVDWKFMSRNEYSTLGFNVGVMFGARARRR